MNAIATPSRVGKKMVSAWVDPEVSLQLRRLALESGTTVQALCDEALSDLFVKYQVSIPATKTVESLVARLLKETTEIASELKKATQQEN